jgi:hypothetical protein
MGKGQVLVFDTYIEKQVEKLKRVHGFYPILKEIGDSCIPPCSPNYVDRALRRLAAAGRLSKEALQVYNAKNNIKDVKGETHEKNSKSRKVKK